MPIVHLLPHPVLCPEGRDLEVKRGASLCQSLLDAGVAIEHACEMVAACATCHVHVRQGGASLKEADDEENDRSTTRGAWTPSRAWPAASRSRTRT